VFGIGVPELMLILVLALIVLGPDKLPNVAKQIARFVGDLKRASEDFKKQLDVEGLEDIRELKEMANLRNPQTWKKNFDRLVDIDTETDDTAVPDREEDKGPAKSDLPGGLGPEWKVAQGRGKTDHEDTGEKSGAQAEQGEEHVRADDVINPEIDPAALEKATGGTVNQDHKGRDADSTPREK